MIGQSEGKKLYIFVFLIVVIIFLSSILLVFIMQGKRIGKDLEIIETGVIRINTVPSNVDAYIDGQKVSITEKVIQSVPLGEVELLLLKDGYTSWKKTLNIEPSVVKDITAQLFPVQFNISQASELNIDEIGFSFDYGYAFFAVLNSDIASENGIWKIKLNFNTLDLDRSSKPELVLNFSATQLEILRAKEYKIMASANADKVLIAIAESNLVWEVDTSEKILNDITENLGIMPNKISFLNKTEGLLVSEINVSYIFSEDFSEKYLISPDINADAHLCKAEDVVYYYDEDLKQVFRLDNTKHTAVLNNLEKGFGKIDSIHCAVNNKNMIVLQTDLGLWYIDLEKKQEELFALSGDIKEVSFTGNSVLYTQDSRIFVANRDISIKELKLKNKELKDILGYGFRFSNDGLNILKSSETELYILDLDGENAYKLLEDASFKLESIFIQGNRKEVYLIVYSKTDNSLENIDTDQGLLYKIDLQ